jgi:hypothetical protein
LREAPEPLDVTRSRQPANSDTLTLALLAGRRPEKYAKQHLEHSGRMDGTPDNARA